MKTIDLGAPGTPTLNDVLALAGEDEVIVRTTDGREFVVAEVDDFGREVEAVRNNPALMQLLAERRKEKGKYTLDEVRRQLELEG